MNRFSLQWQTLFFAGLVFALVIVGKQGTGDAGLFPHTSPIERTSLTASAIQIDEIVTPAPETTKEVVPEEKKIQVRDRLVFALHPDEGRIKQDLPTISAKAALAAELGNQTPLFSKGYANRWPIASITKLMTAVVAIDELNPNDVVTISEKAANEFGEIGGIKAGERFTVLDLMKAMLVGSSNDAAVALAEQYGYDAFLDKMREKAFEFGMQETAFQDTNGISVLNQSTPDDLVKLATTIRKNYPTIFSITSNKAIQITELNSKAKRVVPSTNLFAGTDGFVGGKTGYTGDASGNLISIFSSKGREFIVIVLGTTNRFGETEALWNWVKKSEIF